LQTQDLTGWRAQAGLGSTLDAEQARASTEQLRASLPVLQASIANSEHRLGVLLGQAPAALHERLGASDRIPALTAALPPGVPADLLRRRPDLQAAELSLRAELARLDSAQAARWPTFSLSGSLALQAATLAGLTSSGAWLATLGAAVNWPLLDGGSRAARIEAQTRLAYQAAVLGALEDVENALANVEGTQRQGEALTRATAAARNAQTLATYRYQAGLIDFGTLLDAQRTLLSLENAQASAQTQQSLYLVQLGKALGGDWSEPAAADAPAQKPR
jgi:outer membrane protein TolC